jgi:hypothetical protein
MDDKVTQERVLAFNLATEITPEEMEQVSGGTQGIGSRNPTRDTTMGGQDQTFDVDYD